MDREMRHRFLEDYSRIRLAEGRTSGDSEYFRALPYQDLTGKNSAQWAIRAGATGISRRGVLAEIEKEIGRPLDILDLGAGNGWMSYRLSLREHKPVALDIFSDSGDGLRSTRHYPWRFPCVEARVRRSAVPGWHVRSGDLQLFDSLFDRLPAHSDVKRGAACARPGAS